MEKRRTTIIANIFYIMASLSCASILCAVVLLITNGSIRHAVFVADFRGGFPWRISVADFQWRILRRISVADFRGGFSVADFRGGFAWRILRSGFPWRICLADFAADFVFFLATDLRRPVPEARAAFSCINTFCVSRLFSNCKWLRVRTTAYDGMSSAQHMMI